MTDWAETKARELKAEQDAVDESRRWTLFAERAIEREWQPAWQAIDAAIRQAVDRFNAQGGPAIEIAQASASYVWLRLDRAPDVRVLQVSANQFGVNRVLTVTDQSSHTQAETPLPRVVFHVMPQGVVGLRRAQGVATPDEAAQMLLEPLF